jgi:hypothetical protein
VDAWIIWVVIITGVVNQLQRAVLAYLLLPFVEDLVGPARLGRCKSALPRLSDKSTVQKVNEMSAGAAIRCYG